MSIVDSRIVLRPGPDPEIDLPQRPYARPVVIEIEGEWVPRSIPSLLYWCDGAAAVIAAEPLAGLLLDGGLRSPVVATSADAETIAASWDVDGLPVISDDYIGTGTDTRRWSQPGGDPWSLDRCVAAVAAGRAGIPEGWDSYVEAHAARFERTMALVPQAALRGRALDASAFPLSVRLLDQLGYWVAGTLFAEDGNVGAWPALDFWAEAGMRAEVRWDAERHRLPCDEAMFDLVLAGELIEHLPADPVQLLVEFNRILRYGGTLVLTTPNITSRHSIGQLLRSEHPFNYPLFDRTGSLDRHHQEFTPAMLATMVRRAGFQINTLTTEDVWFPDEPEVIEVLKTQRRQTALRGDSLFVVATKVSGLVDRTPPSVYTGDKSEWALSRTVTPRRADRNVRPEAS